MNKTPEQISEWLRYKPWLKKFMKNCRNIGKIRREGAMKILSGEMGLLTIAAGFTWSRSPEGLGYWKEKDRQFKEWYYGNE